MMARSAGNDTLVAGGGDTGVALSVVFAAAGEAFGTGAFAGGSGTGAGLMTSRVLAAARLAPGAVSRSPALAAAGADCVGSGGREFGAARVVSRGMAAGDDESALGTDGADDAAVGSPAGGIATLGGEFTATGTSTVPLSANVPVARVAATGRERPRMTTTLPAIAANTTTLITTTGTTDRRRRRIGRGCACASRIIASRSVGSCSARAGAGVSCAERATAAPSRRNRTVSSAAERMESPRSRAAA
jgi:hypothetical protein